MGEEFLEDNKEVKAKARKTAHTIVKSRVEM